MFFTTINQGKWIGGVYPSQLICNILFYDSAAFGVAIIRTIDPELSGQIYVQNCQGILLARA